MDALETYTPQISVLGYLMLQPERIGEAMLTLTASDFPSKNCRICWQAMTRLFRDGKTVDVVLLRDALSGFTNVSEFLRTCMEAAPMASNFTAHVQILKRQSMLSQLRELGSSLAECTDLDEALALVDRINEISIFRSARERRSMQQMMRSFADRHSAEVKPDFLQWPLKPLNEGIHVGGGKLLILGGYPSDGKTAFALQSAMVQARNGRKVAFYSFETDADTVEDRVLASAAQINMESIQTNMLSDDDWHRWAMCSEQSNCPFDVIDASGMTVDDIRADTLAHRYQVIYIDYLQYINSARENRNFSRENEVSEISRRLKQLARSAGIDVVALSQLNRPEPDRKGNYPAPTMHNLRESGQIEQDADVIMLLYRLNKDIRSPRHLDVAKNKQGRTGHWQLVFDGIHQTFSMAAIQSPPEGMPKAIKRHLPTPVIGTAEEYEQLPMDEEVPDGW